jgi:hypothetical protein
MAASPLQDLKPGEFYIFRMFKLPARVEEILDLISDVPPALRLLYLIISLTSLEILALSAL